MTCAESTRAFAARHGLTNDQVVKLCWQRRIRGARFNSFTDTWQIFPPAQIVQSAMEGRCHDERQA